MFSPELVARAKALLDMFSERKLTLTTAESCTGGLIAALFTEVPGSSGVFEHGFVTYSNQAKTDMLGVDPLMIERFGAVSEEVAIAMARGARGETQTRLAVSVTGVAGPSGGTKDKPVGTVWIAVASKKEVVAVEKHLFSGDRQSIRIQSVERALEMLKAAL